MRRRLSRRALVVAAVVVAAVAAYYALWRQHVRRFQTVRPGVLYRVAQPSEWGVRYLVARHRVKTILNLRLEDDHLRRGVLGVDGPVGEVESHFVGDLGIHHLQWPMGHEACWPWVTPWQYEEFFRLFDDPTNWPVAVHCVSGRHRTGTIAALYRLEYDRWPIDRVLAEMYSFRFGHPIPLQEINLRTFVPRPVPSAAEWPTLRDTWVPLCAQEPHDYADLVHQLHTSADPEQVRTLLIAELERGGTFALPLARRLIDSPDDPACTAAAAAAAEKCLQSAEREFRTGVPLVASHDLNPPPSQGGARGGSDVAPSTDSPSQPTTADLLSAASLTADFGTPASQALLLELLRSGSTQQNVTPAFRALAAGVSNRYTGNRIPFLTVLLDDVRPMPDTGSVTVRFCDMAVAHLSAILDQRLINAGAYPTPADWETARAYAKSWVTEHPQLVRLTQLQEPTGHNVLR